MQVKFNLPEIDLTQEETMLQERKDIEKFEVEYAG